MINYNIVNQVNYIRGDILDKIDLEVRGAEAVSMFCRLNINAKRNLPIRAGEMGLLILIVKSENYITPLMASEFFKVSKPMIASMTKSLLKKGYIRKTPSKEDKRSYILVPESKAIELVNETYEEYFSLMNRLIKGIGKEKYIEFITLMEEANNILMEERI